MCLIQIWILKESRFWSNTAWRRNGIYGLAFPSVGWDRLLQTQRFQPTSCQRQFAAARVKKTDPAVATTWVQLPQVSADFSGVFGSSYLLGTSVPRCYHFSRVRHVACCSAGETRSADVLPCHRTVLRYMIDSSSLQTRRSRGTTTGRKTSITSAEPAEPLPGLPAGLSRGAASPTVDGGGSPSAHSQRGLLPAGAWGSRGRRLAPCFLSALIGMAHARASACLCICLSMGLHPQPRRRPGTGTRSRGSLAWSSNSSFPL